MLASSTHDTKRSEDVRARISVLSEIPHQWKAALERWSSMNEKHKKNGFPDRNTEYFLYQIMLGAWPIGIDRLWPYMEKACREAKQQTSWVMPNEEFETATHHFVEALYQDEAFLDEFKQFLQLILHPGRINSLSQALLKLTAPGIPDIYQGTELWDLSLVDPDNRRPVDYELRRQLLSEVCRMDVKEVWARMEEGLPKLWTIHHALRARRRYTEAFTGDYRVLNATGSKAHHLVSFMRGRDVVVLVPRLVFQLGNNWEDTSVDIPAGKWHNELTRTSVDGGKLRVGELLEAFPTALLTRK
jgi:(1->4)-alpha-D-glucan 1-alpha-D-glucosylmutase